jgi:hypothetical protein
MNKSISRRDFIKKSAISASAAAALAAGGSARGYAANEKVRICWIGYGGRSSGLMAHMLERCPDAQIVAICDLKQDRLDAGLKAAERFKPKGYHTTTTLGFLDMLEKEKPRVVVVW